MIETMSLAEAEDENEEEEEGEGAGDHADDAAAEAGPYEADE